jgi:hypothetical protein
LITSSDGTVAQMSKLPVTGGAAAVAAGSAALVAAGEGDPVAAEMSVGEAAGELLLHAPRASTAATTRPAVVREW